MKQARQREQQRLPLTEIGLRLFMHDVNPLHETVNVLRVTSLRAIAQAWLPDDVHLFNAVAAPVYSWLVNVEGVQADGVILGAHDADAHAIMLEEWDAATEAAARPSSVDDYVQQIAQANAGRAAALTEQKALQLKQRFRDRVDTIAASDVDITDQGIFIPNWTGDHEHWASALNEMVKRLYDDETRPYFTDVERNPSARADFISTMLRDMQRLYVEAQMRVRFYSRAYSHAIPPPIELAKKLFVQTGRTTEQIFYFLAPANGIKPADDTTRQRFEPLFRETVESVIAALTRDGVESGGADASRLAHLLSAVQARTFFVFEYIRVGPIYQRESARPVDPFALYIDAKQNAVGIGLSLRMFIAHQSVTPVTTTRASAQFFLCAAIAKLVSPPNTKRTRRPPGSVHKAELPLDTENMSFFRVLRFCLNAVALVDKQRYSWYLSPLHTPWNARTSPAELIRAAVFFVEDMAHSGYKRLREGPDPDAIEVDDDDDYAAREGTTPPTPLDDINATDSSSSGDIDNSTNRLQVMLC